LTELMFRTPVQCVFLLLCGFAVRFPALQGQLIWDDDYLAKANPFIKSPLFVFEVFKHSLFPESFAGHYRPVQNISFMPDYWLWNDNTWGFHFSNISWHVGSSLLLYFLLRKLLPSLTRSSETGAAPDDSRARRFGFIAFMVALLWTVHPVHSAAIDYISGRADSLAFFFCAGAWLLFIKAQQSLSRIWSAAMYAAAAISGLLALCSREIAAIWIALFLLHLFCFEKRIGLRTKMLTLLCCLVVIGAYVGLRNLPLNHNGPGPTNGWGKTVRATLMLRALGDYSRLLAFPSNLHMERTVFDPNVYQGNAGWRDAIGTEYLSILGVLVLAALVVGASWKGVGRPLRIAGGSWFLLAYLPISNLVELNATVAEHWLYLPSVGVLLFAVGVVLDLPVRFQKLATAGACIAVAAFGLRSYVRSTDWVTAQTFYERTIAAGGPSGRVSSNLGLIYANQGEYVRAEALFRELLRTSPDYPIARNNLAEVLYRQGKKEDAEKIFSASAKAAEQSRKEYPRTWIAALNMAHLRHNNHDDAAALEITAKARKDYPNTWQIISFESEILQLSGKPEAALALVQSYVRDNWWHYPATLALGRLLAQMGDGKGAEAVLNQASRLDVHEVEALNLISSMQLRQNRLHDALATQQRATARQPDEPRQYSLLSDLLEKAGQKDQARIAMANVARLHALVGSEPKSLPPLGR
jgi:Flp pilus assembly protein TadD